MQSQSRIAPRPMTRGRAFGLGLARCQYLRTGPTQNSDAHLPSSLTRPLARWYFLER